MESTTTGRLVLWLATSLIVVGALLSNAVILLSAVLLFLYLVIEAASFHHAVNLATEAIRLESHPSRIETTVGRPFKVETVFTNTSHSEFSIVRFSHNLSPQIDKEPDNPPTLTLQSHGRQQTETLLRTKIAGRFEITASMALLERRSHFFSQVVVFPNEVVILAQPLVSRSVDPIESSVLDDLVSDHSRRGSGTDLAGIRPYNIHDDFRAIDWKTTARSGRLMIKESYLERDPTIILMVDVSSSMNARRHGSCPLDAFLNEAGDFLTSIRIANPVGLILYDEQEIVANIEAMQGTRSRERILRTLLEMSNNTSVEVSPERRIIRPYADLAKATNSVTEKSTFAAKVDGNWERLFNFANFVLPFYDKAQSKYLERIRGKGVFKAFEMICDLPEPVLVIVISSEEVNLDGFAEGAKRARILNHQVVLTILVAAERTGHTEISSDLERYGMRVLRCRPEEISRAIGVEILRSGQTRNVRVEPNQWK